MNEPVATTAKCRHARKMACFERYARRRFVHLLLLLLFASCMQHVTKHKREWACLANQSLEMHFGTIDYDNLMYINLK